MIEEALTEAIGQFAGDEAAEAISFFILDSVKIIILLFLMITLVGFLRTYLPKHKVKNWVSGKKYGLGNLIASLFGSVTPFCSCSSIPVFLSFLKAGLPIGVAFSFLITSPIVNEYLVVLMLAFFGWKITLAYVVSGVLIGTFSGMVLGRLKLEKHIVEDMMPGEVRDAKYSSVKERIYSGLKESTKLIKSLWLWVIVGVGIGALIHNYVPPELVQSIVSNGGIFSVPAAVILGVPIYGSCAAIVPIAVALFNKGVPLGTALAFMMAISALSLPEAVILRRAMKLKLIAIFFGIVAAAIMLTGYVFNALQGVLS